MKTIIKWNKWICPKCGKYSLIGMTESGECKNLHWFELLNNPLHHIKCMDCNTEFAIDWTDGSPCPLIQLEKLNKFLNI